GAAVRDVVHATTVATNAVMERKGVRTGMVKTHGFRDTLEIGREARYDIYDLQLSGPPPVVERPACIEVLERLDYRGEIVTPLDDGSVDAAIEQLARAGVRAVAVCLLYSHVNAAHERRVAERIRAALPDLEVSVSSEVAPEAREFERMSTTCVDAYVKPLVRNYIVRLEQAMRKLGVRQQLSLMLSHGGIGSAADVVSRFPVRMIESGPAAGAIAAAHYGEQALGRSDAVAFDMGGTTAKISLIRGGVPAVTQEYEVGHVHRFKRGSGIPLQISAIELLEIGAGGGSIASLNRLGLLGVGPESSGSEPGPVCYRRGGTEPTVTDADLVLGYLDAGSFLGGDMALDLEGARRAIGERIGEPLGMRIEDAARGIHRVVNERMSAAIRAHAAEKGVDLRRFSLIAFGGAGPVHAYAIARSLGISRVLCPFGAGVASAIGCLVATPAVDLIASYSGELAAVRWQQAAGQFRAMRASGLEMIRALVGPEVPVELVPQFEMRCVGQGYSVIVALAPDTPIDGSAAAAIAREFEQVYGQTYGHRPPPVPLEIVNLRARVRAVRTLRPFSFGAASTARAAGSSRKGERSVFFEAAANFVATPVYDRYALRSGERIAGPAIIEERETSIVVGPDARFSIDPNRNLIIDIEAADPHAGGEQGAR
ncbi:MAG: hydantoinase/oxoprolinase family protein, partial [Lautropia sp.]